MALPLSIAVAVGLLTSATSQRRAAARYRALAASTTATVAELRAALAHAATKLETHSDLTEAAVELCGPASGHRE